MNSFGLRQAQLKIKYFYVRVGTHVFYNIKYIMYRFLKKLRKNFTIMSFLGLTGAMIGSAAGEGILNGVTGLISNGIGGLFSGIGKRKRQKRAENFQREMMEKQHEYELEKMGIQADYNKEQAEYTQKLGKEMWDYTNYENQIKHLEAAGLNPGLMYGMSGGGGSTTAGGEAAGVSQGVSQAVGMGLQARSIMAEIEKTEAEANLANAQATKATGADTRESNSQTSLNNSVERLNSMNRRYLYEKTELTEQQIENLKGELNKLTEEAISIKIDNEIRKATKLSEIEKAAHEAYNAAYTGMQILADAGLKDETRKNMIEKTKWLAFEVMTGRISAEAAKEQAKAFAKRVANEKEYWDANINLGKEGITQRYWELGVNSFVDLIDTLSDLVPTKSAGKIIDRVTEWINPETGEKESTRVQERSETRKRGK